MSWAEDNPAQAVREAEGFPALTFDPESDIRDGEAPLKTNLKIMAGPEHSSGNSDNPPTPAENERKSASMDALLRALEAFQQGVSANNSEQVEAAALNALGAAAEEAEKNPTPELELKQEAAECEAHGDWAGAEACCRKVLALEEAAGNGGLRCKAHYDLSRLFLLIGDLVG